MKSDTIRFLAQKDHTGKVDNLKRIRTEVGRNVNKNVGLLVIIVYLCFH